MIILVAYILLFCIALVGILVGLLAIFNPRLAIKLQQKFYSKINWKIEPISLEKELRNTKIMGHFSLAISLLIIFLLGIKL